jgi:NH3-dependent NAD+ synthetase
MPLLQKFVDAPPTAELEPITETYTQSDEVDMVRNRGSTFLLFGSISRRVPLKKSALETCLGSTSSKPLLEEVIANSPFTDRA